MGKKKDDDFFVGIKDPLDMRRTLLESSREIIQSLQRYESFRAVREEKQAKVEELKSAIKDIKKLVNDLKNALPKTELRVKLHKEAKRFEEEEAYKPKPVKRILKPAARELTELEKLEAELVDIEKKLGKLA